MTEENKPVEKKEELNVVDIPKAGVTIALDDGVTFDIVNVKVEPNTTVISEDDVDNLVEEIVSSIETGDIVDLETADFEIDYNNRVVLNSVDIERREIERNVESALRDFFNVRG